MTQPGYVTYEQMVAYVRTIVAPVVEHAEEHDAWHLRIMEAERAQRISSFAQWAANIIAAVAVIVAMVAVFIAHVH